MTQPPWHLTPNAPLDMDGQKITNLAPGVAADDAATVAQAGGGGSSIPQGGPLTEDLLAGGFGIRDTNALTARRPDIGEGSGGLLDGTGYLSLNVASGGERPYAAIQVNDADSPYAALFLVLTTGTTRGTVIFGGNAVPADGELSPANCAYAFDPTNAAGAFNLKGKTADGTVVTATIPMAHVQVLGWITEPPDGAAVKYDQANRALASAQQTALADLNLGTLTLLTDAITAIGTMQTKINSLLAKLRTAGVLAT